MPTLYLLRHAKTEPGEPGQPDRSRVLTPRGESDAQLIGAHLQLHQFIPELVLVSSATRTQQTWAIVSKELEKPVSSQTEANIYDADVDTLLQIISQTSDAIQNLMLVGHNPGMYELASHFLERNSGVDEFPPGSFCAIACDGGFRLHARKKCVLKHFIMPKMLRSE